MAAEPSAGLAPSNADSSIWLPSRGSAVDSVAAGAYHPAPRDVPARGVATGVGARNARRRATIPAGAAIVACPASPDGRSVVIGVCRERSRQPPVAESRVRGNQGAAGGSSAPERCPVSTAGPYVHGSRWVVRCAIRGFLWWGVTPRRDGWVQPTSGSLRVFWQFPTPRQDSVFEPCPRPTHLRLTQAVGPPFVRD
jgi:hypothetical protein